MTATVTHNDSAFRALYALVTQTLTRVGVNVGGTAEYPRIEIHTITENERLDKSGDFRRMSCTVESMTIDSLLDCHHLNADNLALLDTLTGTRTKGYSVDGVVFGQLQEITDTADTKAIVYRLLQTVDFYLMKFGNEDDPQPSSDTGTMGQNEPVETAGQTDGPTEPSDEQTS